MESPNDHLPPWTLLWLRIFIHKEYREEIEGDLIEKFQSDSIRYGHTIAQKELWSACFSLLQFNLIFNINPFSFMHSRHGFYLMVISLLVIIGSVSPFLPGPNNDFTHQLSRFAQTIGFVGMVFTPFGLIWFIIELRNKKDQKLNRWTNGYYPAWLTLLPVFVFIPLQIGRAVYVQSRMDFDLWPLVIVAAIMSFLILRILKLKNKTNYKFNTVPVYIVLIPFVAMLTSKVAVNTAAAMTREKTILKTEPLIEALEKYKQTTGTYPEQLNDLVGNYIPEIPHFDVMGLRAYHYKKSSEAYQLSFEQRYHWFATEVVAYMKNGHDITKADYENYPTKNPDWRYFMAD